MKTKNKVLALLEIAVVLCSLFLVALPALAIAAEEDDYVLGVYGNANEDDTIDMRDLTYVKLIFFGKKPETELADAKYDGKINPLDFIQIKLIIVGKEKELTIVQYIGHPADITEEPVTVPMPIERIVSLTGYNFETLCALGVQDMVVGLDEYTTKMGELKTFVKDKPVVAAFKKWDLEKIMELKPDIVLSYSFQIYPAYPDYEKKLNAAGIQLVLMDFYQSEKYSREIRNMGWMLDKQERAEELSNFEQQHRDLIKERVKELKPEEKPRVYFSTYPYSRGPTKTAGGGGGYDTRIKFCGGINIFADEKGTVVVDPEAIIVRNPQVIFATTHATATGALGYGITDTGPVEKVRTENFMNYPGFGHIDAVKKGRVYFVSTNAQSTHPVIFLLYLAKYFHPDLFEDIDPVDIHRDWLETFLGIEYKGVYAYPYPPVS
jgi:iron complex transport system substrate-binding protein